MKTNKRALCEALGAEFYRCPNTQEIIIGAADDDKVLCGCGHQNARVPGPGREVHVVEGHLLTNHIKRWLEKADFDDYEQQMRQIEENHRGGGLA